MRLVRTILAFAIAISLAMLPIGASAAGVTTSSGDMRTSMHMSGGVGMSADDCCPGDMKGATSHKDGYKCRIGLCCAGGIVAFGDVRAIAFETLAVTATKIALPDDQVVSLHRGNPPFRPPRI